MKLEPGMCSQPQNPLLAKLKSQMENLTSEELDFVEGQKRNVEFLVQSIFQYCIDKMSQGRKCWINNNPGWKLSCVKGLLKPEFTLNRKKTKYEEDELEYIEYPILAVYVRPASKTKKADILNEAPKIFKTLREYCKCFRTTKLIGIITNMQQWQFVKYDVDKEVRAYCKPQITKRVLELQSSAINSQENKFTPFSSKLPF